MPGSRPLPNFPNRFPTVYSGGFIRTRLFALTVLCVVPAMLFVMYSAWNRYRAEVESTQADTLTVARLVAEEHEARVRDSRLLLGAMSLAFVGDRQGWEGGDCSARLAKLLSLNPAYSQLVVADASGAGTCSALPLNKPLHINDRPYFIQAMEKKTFSVSSVIDGRVSGKKVIVLAQPVLGSGGQPVAVIVASLGLDWIETRLASAGLPDSANAILMGPDGRVLHGFRRPDIEGRTNGGAATFLKAITERDQGTLEDVPGNDGVDRVVSFRRLSHDPELFLSVGYPKAEIKRRVLAALTGPFVLFFALLGSQLVVAWVGGYLLVGRPIRRLTEAASRLGRGDLKARTGLAHGKDDMGRLANKLDDLASHAERITRALNALSAGNRAIVHHQNEQVLLTEMCKVLVEQARYPCAVVHYALPDENRSLQRMAVAGDDHGYFVSAPDISWREDETGSSTIGTAIRSGQRSVARRVTSDARMTRWLSDIVKRGWRAKASFPLMIERQCIGALTLFAAEEDAFDESEVELLDELALDLAFGISVIRDRERKREAEQLVEYASTHDQIVDLPNLGWFLGNLAHQIEQAREAREPLAVLFAHLPRLHELYEALGYATGNEVIRAIAGRLTASHSALSTMARVGFEDFAVVLPESDFQKASSIAQAFVSTLEVPVVTASSRVDLQIGFGMSFFPGHGDSPDLLLRRAGIAARDASRKGMPFSAYQGSTDRESPARLEMAAALRAGLENRELWLEYQPKVDLKTRKVTSVEALVRWRRQDGSTVPPAQFVPIAEHTGLIRPMTDAIIDLAVRQQRAWLDAGHQLPIAVNLSARNLYDVGLLERVKGLLTTWGVPPHLIEFEVTESALMEEPAVAKTVIAALRDSGSRVFIDDFGTGYSSLSYLVSLPFHALKIDRSFVVGMLRSASQRSIIASVISMAHTLNLRAVAEGVETSQELQELQAMGCDEVQGYVFAAPMSADRLLEWTAGYVPKGL